MARRARFEYVQEEWTNIFNELELSPDELGQICGISGRHFRNILNGEVQIVRFRTKRKIQNGLENRGIAREQTERLFQIRNNFRRLTGE